MNRILHTLLTFIMAIALASCADSGPTAPPASSPLTLALGETVRLRNTDLFVRFDRVVSESRCPMGMLCIVAGEAIVEMTASERGRTETFLLHLAGFEGQNDSSAPPVSALGHRFRLFSLDPYPGTKPDLLIVRRVATVIVD